MLNKKCICWYKNLNIFLKIQESVEWLFLNDVHERYFTSYPCALVRQLLSGGKTMINPANMAGASYCVKTCEWYVLMVKIEVLDVGLH